MLVYHAVLDFPCCRLGAIFCGETLTRLDFLPPDHPLRTPGDARTRRLRCQIERYCDDAAHVFTLPFAAHGTPYQALVWAALGDIPAGHTLTYGALAQRIGSAARAIGQACAANPLPILIPCHRVVAASGPGGFNHAASGAPIAVKRWLLDHERPAD
jgi:methylated-DNA-[protein]-cysteine S-methyltransferase